MIELILSTLAEFGLIGEDFKHHRKVSKQEKKDGKKRPFKRYLFQPSSIMVILFFVIGILSLIVFTIYQRSSIFPEKTQKEIKEISSRAVKWKEEYGKFPSNLNELIGNNPMRQGWKNDSWDQPYRYLISENEKEFTIISAGPDGKFETGDDIKTK